MALKVCNNHIRYHNWTWVTNMNNLTQFWHVWRSFNLVLWHVISTLVVISFAAYYNFYKSLTLSDNGSILSVFSHNSYKTYTQFLHNPRIFLIHFICTNCVICALRSKCSHNLITRLSQFWHNFEKNTQFLHNLYTIFMQTFRTLTVSDDICCTFSLSFAQIVSFSKIGSIHTWEQSKVWRTLVLCSFYRHISRLTTISD